MDVKRETSSSKNGAKEEKDAESNGHANNCIEERKVRNEDESDKSAKTSSPKHEDPRICEKDDLESAKEENERLKKILERVENDYRSLQTRFFDIFQHEPPLKSADMSTSNEVQNEEEPEILLSLGLRTLEKTNKDDSTDSSSKRKADVQPVNEELSLGLDFKRQPKTDSSDTGSEKSNGNDDTKGDEIGETWPPSKVLKTMKNSRTDEELPERNNAKRARVCVRARCDTPTMNDGCQWRKYGQKIAKGNPCPRAYYRCTVAPSCPVRKQVQRCSDDMSILITSYEGTHNHALPAAATAMASTTSAAASMLLSGSSTSEGLSPSASTTTTTNLNGLNFTLSNNLRTGQFNLPNSSSPAPPTITLDLTGPQSSHFSRKLTNSFLPSTKYSSRSLDFSTSEANIFPTAWNNTYMSYSSLPSTKNPIGSLSFGKPSPQQISYPHIERSHHPATSSTSQQFLTETLTKVLTSDPSFQSAVAAAISSMVGSNNTLAALNHGNVNTLGSNLKWGDPVQGISINSLPQNGMACTPTYLHKLPPLPPSSSSSPAAGSFMILQPQFPFSLPKSSSSPDLRDHLK